MNLLFAAQSGWGKSYHSQAWLEKNLPDYDYGVVLDYKDEYRGLVKAGLAKHWIAGPKETRWGPAHWKRVLEQTDHLVLARHPELDEETWREVCAAVITAARRLDGSSLTAIDEAHFVAPQQGKLLAPIKGLATTGRGEDASSVWISQRLAEMHETVIAQCQSRILGAFESSADLGKVRKVVEYPADLHNPQAGDVAHAPEELQRPDASGGLVPVLEKFVDDQGNTVGSEWIYSDNTGERRRLNTKYVEMTSTHYGSQGQPLKMPDYGD